MDPPGPVSWPYSALADVPYRGHRVAVAWDHDETRFEPGKGLHLPADGRTLAASGP